MDKRERDRIVKRQKRKLEPYQTYSTGLTDGVSASVTLPKTMTPKDFELLRGFIDLLEEAATWNDEDSQPSE
jgi:hypothetical protein